MQVVYVLAFAPVSKIVKAWEKAIKPYFERYMRRYEATWPNDHIRSWLNYVENTYIGKKVVVGVTSYRREPMFPHNMWNLYDRIQRDLPFTNNQLEGHNSAWALFCTKTQNIWKCIKGFMREDGLGTQKHLELSTSTNTILHPG